MLQGVNKLAGVMSGSYLDLYKCIAYFGVTCLFFTPQNFIMLCFKMLSHQLFPHTHKYSDLGQQVADLACSYQSVFPCPPHRNSVISLYLIACYYSMLRECICNLGFLLFLQVHHALWYRWTLVEKTFVEVTMVK